MHDLKPSLSSHPQPKNQMTNNQVSNIKTVGQKENVNEELSIN